MLWGQPGPVWRGAGALPGAGRPLWWWGRCEPWGECAHGFPVVTTNFFCGLLSFGVATKKDISCWGVSCEMDEPMFGSYGGSGVDEVCEREFAGRCWLSYPGKDFMSEQTWDLQRPCLLKAMGSDTRSREEVGVKMEPRYPCCVIADWARSPGLWQLGKSSSLANLPTAK